MKSTQRKNAAVEYRNQKELPYLGSDGPLELQEVLDTAGKAFKSYATQNPAVVAVVAFFAGFYVGWKVKPW